MPIVPLLLILVGLLPGCAASVAGSTPSGIWFDEPFIGGWSEADIAAKHCAAYGRSAVYRGRLLGDRGYTTPVSVWDCR